MGRLYAGEAYALLDRVGAAVEVLSPEAVAEVADPRGRPLYPWVPQSTPSARAVMQYNLAVALVLRGDLEKASDILKQVCFIKLNHVTKTV